MTKPHIEIWQELRGSVALSLETAEKTSYQSISKTKTFTPPSSDRGFILSLFSKNVENACIKARRYKLEAKHAFFLLRSQDYRYSGYEVTLSRPTNIPSDIMRVVQEHFDMVYRPTVLYRLTGVVLSGLHGEGDAQLDLFGKALRAERVRQVYNAVDQLDTKYGKHTVFLGSSFAAIRGSHPAGARAEPPGRQSILLKGEGARQRVGIPLMGEVREERKFKRHFRAGPAGAHLPGPLRIPRRRRCGASSSPRAAAG
jgi:hypothetical protein